MAKVKGLSFYQKESKINKNLIKQILDIIISTIITVFIAFVITFIFGSRTSIIGDSMEPGLESSSQVLINKFVYMVTKPQKGDVIVFLPNGNTNTHYYIKRVVAIPGQTVKISEGRLYVNGLATEAESDYDYIIDPGMAESDILLGQDEYFVLGDNRNSSEDSRSGNIGPVNKNNIIGKAWLKLPFGDETFTLVR